MHDPVVCDTMGGGGSGGCSGELGTIKKKIPHTITATLAGRDATFVLCDVSRKIIKPFRKKIACDNKTTMTNPVEEEDGGYDAGPRWRCDNGWVRGESFCVSVRGDRRRCRCAAAVMEKRGDFGPERPARLLLAGSAGGASISGNSVNVVFARQRRRLPRAR